jgi:glycosyltransferase involved in cell wall biosynthesis
MPLPKNSSVHILMPARVVGDKGAREFIQAASIIRSTRRDIHFAIAGAPDAKNPTCLGSDEVQAAKRFVTFLGHQSDMQALYTQADVVCLPSYREGLPKALLEAASTGRPLVAADAPGSREIVKDGINGALVPVGDAMALAQMILSLADDRDLREEYGQASAQIVRQDYAMPIINAQMLQIYEAAHAQVAAL